MNRKILNIMSWMTISVTFALILLFGFWELYPYKTIKFNSNLVLYPSKARAGDYVTMRVDYCKYIDKPATIETSFVDSIVYSLSEVVANNSKGCRISSVLIQIPPGLPAETYVVKKVYSYQVNPIKKIRVEVQSEPFEIIK